MTLFFSFLPVDVVDDDTVYNTSRESLEILKYNASNMKRYLIDLITSFALTLDINTIAFIANNTFIKSHKRMRQGKDSMARDSKL